MKEFLSTDKLRLGIINYELTFRRKELLKLKDFTMMLDESSYIKNERAKRTKFILKLNYENVILLSGTPVSGKYEELYSQLQLLNYNITKKAFYSMYIETIKLNVGGFPIFKVVGYKNVDRLKDKLKDYGAVFMKTEEVIDLPRQTDIDMKVKSTKTYKDFKKDSYVDLGKEELIGDNTLTKMLYERQLCGIYNKDKQNQFKDQLEGTNDRLIVFYNFTREYEILREIAEKLDKPISVVNGKERSLKNYEEENNSVTFIQYQAGSRGLNLQKANKIIYFTPTLSAEMYMQSRKRVHRISQDRPCYYYHMKVEGTIETKIYESLDKGIDYTNKLFEK